ncbi:C-type lectin mosGCTL-7-like [Rhynchophorus ferrugineus]|uniref:C-type lectin mosGCTL-7-like n=1 Tax=Rhynchophorus ferrugineus TaxID=354439 RepID=UPI003FCEC777
MTSVVVSTVGFLLLITIRIIVSCDTNSKYMISNQRVTFHDAYVRCRQHGFDPVEILSGQDEKEIEAALKNETAYSWVNGYWIFATNLGDYTNFYWLDSGKPLLFSQFDVSEPKSFEDANCLEIYKTSPDNFLWCSAACDTKLKFICKYREM